MTSRETHAHLLQVRGLDCPTCAKDLESAVRAQEGIAAADLDFMAGLLRLTCRLESGCLQVLNDLGREHGVVFVDLSPDVPDPSLSDSPPHAHEHASDKPSHVSVPGEERIGEVSPPPVEIRVMVAAAMALAGGWVSGVTWGYLPAIAIGSWPILPKAWAEFRRLRLGMNFLMLVAAVGAALIGETQEGAVVLFLFSVARWLERLSSERARVSIEALRARLPARAVVIADGLEKEVPVADVAVGQRIRLRPGDNIPLDGTVREGESPVDESALTGESEPVTKSAGHDVFAGTGNLLGTLLVEVTAPAAASRFSRIMLSVQKAQSRKTRIQSSLERFAEVYTPVVVFLALLLAVLPPLLGFGAWTVWIHTALVLLVVACPCALVLSAPVTMVAAMASAARSGILVRGGDVFEAAARVKVVAFDKTGTLTMGEPAILECIPIDRCGIPGLLRLAAALEAGSEHPLAPAFARRARADGLSVPTVTGFATVRGRGVAGTIDGVEYRFGREDWALERCPSWKGVIPPVAASCVTVSLLCDDTGPLGMVLMGDRLRPEVQAVMGHLRGLGIHRTVLLSGDREEVVRDIGSVVGVDLSLGRVSPEEKGLRLADLAHGIGPTLMLGDGINDTPALASADVGVAMGGRGADAALETAGVVLLHDDLTRLPLFLLLARRALRLIRQNLALAIGLKAAVFALSLFGLATLWMAVLADTGASVLVVLNGLRALRVVSLPVRLVA